MLMASCMTSGRSDRHPAAAIRSGQPIRLEISLTESDLVKELRRQTSDMRVQLEELQARVNRAEYRYRCASVLNMRLTDWLREQRIRVPREIAQVKDIDL